MLGYNDRRGNGLQRRSSFNGGDNYAQNSRPTQQPSPYGSGEAASYMDPNNKFGPYSSGRQNYNDNTYNNNKPSSRYNFNNSNHFE